MTSRAVALVIAIVGLALLASCGGGTGTAPDGLVPEGSDLVTQVQVARILEESEADNPLSELVTKGVIGDSLEEAFAEIGVEGIDANSVSTLISFVDLSQPSLSMGNRAGGTIMAGRFDEEVITESLLETPSEGYYTQYNGITVYVGVGDEDESLAVIKDDVLVYGMYEMVKAVIDVHAGDKNSVSGQLVDSFNSLGEPIFKAVMNIPPEHYVQLFQGEDSFEGAAIEGALEELELVTVVADKKGALNTLAVTMSHSSAPAAELMKEQVGQMLNILRFYVGEPAKEFLDKVVIETNGTELDIKARSSPEELRQFVDNFGMEAESYLAIVISLFLGQVPNFGGH